MRRRGLRSLSDGSALAGHLRTLLGDRARRGRMGVAARAMIEDRFDLFRQIARLESLYEEVRTRRG